LITQQDLEGQLAPEQSSSLGADIDSCELAFETALEGADAPGAARAALELESAIRHWSADTLQSDVMDRAHGALRSMIVRLGDVAVRGLIDPRSVIDPYMTLLLELRGAVRADKRYDLSDLIRDRLSALSIEVRDTSEGVEWDLRTLDS
jgi:cysteinyl-tRNA synthetase